MASMMPPLHFLFGFGIFLIFISVVVNYFNTTVAMLVSLLIVALLFKELTTPEYPEIETFDPDSDLYEDFLNY